MSAPKTEQNSEQKTQPRSKDGKPYLIGFRLTEEEHEQAETWAAVDGIPVSEWCRKTVQERLKEARGMSLHTRIMYEEIARLRFITGYCFRLLASGELDEEAFEKVRATAEEKGAVIADNLLRRAMQNGESNKAAEEGDEDG